MDASTRARFEAKVDRSGGPDACHLWTGARSGGNGDPRHRYGYLGLGKSRVVRAHRLAWEAVNGAIPATLMVCHRCDTPLCVNVAHLFLGTARQNAADAAAKGRTTLGERDSQAKLTAADVAEIRRLAGAESHTRIAARFGVSRRAVGHVVNRATWRHV